MRWANEFERFEGRIPVLPFHLCQALAVTHKNVRDVRHFQPRVPDRTGKGAGPIHRARIRPGTGDRCPIRWRMASLAPWCQGQIRLL